MQKTLTGALAGAAVAVVAGGATLALSSGPATDSLKVSVDGQTATSISMSWAPPSDAVGYVFKVNGAVVANTWDPARSSITFSRRPEPATYTVSAVTGRTGVVTTPLPPTPSTTTAPTTTATTTTTPTTTAAPTTTTGPPTTTTASAPSYASAIAYTQTHPAFTALRQINVTSQAELQSAVTGVRAGDRITATAPFTVTGEFVINENPTGPAELDLAGVTFSYSGTSELPSVWIVNASNFRIYGGDVHGPPVGQVGDGGVTVYHVTNILWWGLHIHDVAGTALGIVPVGGPITGLDIQAEVDHWGENPSYDPHAEKGTGEHGANIVDGGTNIYTGNRIALYAHDGLTGAAIQIGSPNTSGQITGNTIILKAERLLFAAKSQVAGNALQLWGAVPMQIKVPYLEATDLQGRAVDTNGVYSGTSQAGVVVAYGRATRTNLNPLVSSGAWDPRYGVTYGDVSGP